MNRTFKRIVYALGTLGLGALAYALLRSEGERVLAPVKERLGSGPSGRTEEEAGGRPQAAGAGDAPVRASAPRRARGAKAAPAPAVPAAAARTADSPDRCAARTKSGARCARAPLPDSEYCWQHQPG